MIQLPISMNKLQDYLDTAIRNWRCILRNAKTDHSKHTCCCYIDAFQSVRISFFGMLLPKEDN